MSTPPESVTPSSEIKKEKKSKKIKKEYIEEEVATETAQASEEAVGEKVRYLIYLLPIHLMMILNK